MQDNFRQLLRLLGPRRHALDFASVLWDGRAYSFTPTQGAIVRALWEALSNGTPDLRQETLLAAASSDTGRLQELFRNNQAWGVMIVPGATKGTFRLAPEEA
jgi:hypothetical protein